MLSNSAMVAARVASTWMLALSLAPASAMASAESRVSVAFSPDGGAERLVLQVIDGAKSSIRLAGYSFTAPPVTRSLVEAKRRGVDVAVVVDQEINLKQPDRKAVAALNALVGAGIPVRIVSVYPVQHSKYIVADGLQVETGSYNYSTAAARYNSENVVVIWNRGDIAQQYIDNWQGLYNQGHTYRASF